MAGFLFAIVLSLFTAHSFAQAPTVLGKTVDRWEKQLAADDQDRHLAAWAIAHSGPSAHEALLAHQQHADPVVRFWIIQGIGRNAAEKKPGAPRQKYLSALRRALQDRADAPRIAAAAQLARLGNVDEALPILTAALDDPQDPAGIQAAAALATLGRQAAPARAKLQNAAANGSEYVKRLATRALKNIEE